MPVRIAIVFKLNCVVSPMINDNDYSKKKSHLNQLIIRRGIYGCSSRCELVDIILHDQMKNM